MGLLDRQGWEEVQSAAEMRLQLGEHSTECSNRVLFANVNLQAGNLDNTDFVVGP